LGCWSATVDDGEWVLTSYLAANAGLQLWTWFVGMIVLTFPWHYVGALQGVRQIGLTHRTSHEPGACEEPEAERGSEL